MDPDVLELLAETVRQESRAGALVRLEEFCPGGEGEFAALTAAPGAGAMDDMRLIHEGGRTWLFSDRHMTRPYAEAAALGSSGDPLRIIADTVRSDSATYPRPTPIEVFCGRPFSLSMEDVVAAVGRMRADVEYADIGSARASNGDRFLFSSRHLDPAQAESMSEWIAVGRCDNP